MTSSLSDRELVGSLTSLPDGRLVNSSERTAEAGHVPPLTAVNFSASWRNAMWPNPSVKRAAPRDAGFCRLLQTSGSRRR